MSVKRDIDILKHLIKHCQEIELTRQRFGDAFEVLKEDFVYKNAVAMNVLQIGELSTHLSKDFRLAHDHMPWRDIIDMRNIAAHHYTKFNTKTLWETINYDIPRLKIFCQEQLGMIMTQQASEETGPKPPRP
jgi:uncharacterized protein with HEPN domain